MELDELIKNTNLGKITQVMKLNWLTLLFFLRISKA